MKKTFITILSTMSLLCCVCFTGCGKSENSSEMIESTAESSTPVGVESTEKSGNVKAVTENYHADFQTCQNTDYVNLDWTNTGKCPVYPVSELYNIEYKDTLSSSEIPPKEMLDRFKEYCNFYFGECFDDFAFFRPGINDMDTLPTPSKIIVNGGSYSGYNKISDYREKLEDGSIEINFLVYRNIEKKQYMLWCTGLYPHWINKGGALTVLDENTNKCSSWLPSDMGKPIARYYNDGKSDDVKYRLADGEVSIGEAIKYLTEEYPKTLPYEDKTMYSVKYVDVYEIGTGTYCYLLNNTMLFDLVAFESIGEIVVDSSVPLYYAIDGQALMIKKDDINVAYDCDPKTMVRKDGDPIPNILSLKEASDIVSQKLSQNVKFNVVSTELIYHGTRDSENVAHLKPTWEFRLYNKNDASYYTAYVDAASGDCNYFRYSLG